MEFEFKVNFFVFATVQKVVRQKQWAAESWFRVVIVNMILFPLYVWLLRKNGH